MIQKIKNIMLTLAAITMAALPVAVPAAVYADNITGAVCGGVGIAANGSTAVDPNASDCTTDSTASTSGLYAIAAKVVNIFSVIVGIVAVLMIIFGGFKYITSGGESGKVGGAKNSLVYAIVGLIIVALAQFIVHYVLSTAGTASASAN